MFPDATSFFSSSENNLPLAQQHIHWRKNILEALQLSPFLGISFWRLIHLNVFLRKLKTPRENIGNSRERIGGEEEFSIARVTCMNVHLATDIVSLNTIPECLACEMR